MWNRLKKIIRHYKIYAFTFLVFAVWLVFFDRANIVGWVSDVIDVRSKKEQKRYYEKEINRINQSINELNDNESLEKYARENLYFKNDDEDVYIIEETE